MPEMRKVTLVMGEIKEIGDSAEDKLKLAHFKGGIFSKE